jgi:cell division protein ZapA
MSEEPIGVNIRVLDKEYRIACQPEEQDDLLASARLLDGRMREIRQTGRVIGADRIAVLAALNIAHELIQTRQGLGGDRETARRLELIQDRVSRALSPDPPLDATGESV